MSKRIWVLGVRRPEMEMIEGLLRECGEHVVYAAGRPVHVGDATTIYLVECSPPLACGAGWDDPGSYYEPVKIGARYYPRADADTRRIVDICPYLPDTPEASLPASIVGRVIAELARAGVALPWDSEYVPGLAVGRYFLADSGRYLIGTTDGALYVPPQYVHAEVDLTPEDLTAVETSKREVCGSYPGAVPWMTHSDEPPAQLASELARSAGCAYYDVDGVTYGPFDESAEEAS